MTQPTREKVLAGLLLVLLAGAAAWSIDRMMGKRRLAAQAAEDLAACRSLERLLKGEANQLTSGTEGSAGSDRLSKQIMLACQQSAIAYDPIPGEPSLDGVFPQSPQPSADRTRMEVPTSLAFRNVRLHDLAAFLYYLSAGSGVTVRELRLRVPRSDAEEAWDAEATVVYSVPRAAQD